MEIESQELHKKHRKYLPEPIFDCISEEMLVLKNFLSIIKCPICFHLFTIPVTLLCGHSFCKGCISRCLGCPICKKKFLTLPEKSIILSDLVNSQKIFCPSHFDPDTEPCNTLNLTSVTIKLHVMDCENITLKCNCGKMIPRKNYLKNDENYFFRLVNCASS